MKQSNTVNDFWHSHTFLIFIIVSMKLKEKLNVFDTRTHLYAFAKNLFIKIKSHLLILCIIAFNHSGYYKQSNSLPDIIGRKGADVKRECPFKLIWFSRGQCVEKGLQ